MLKEITKAYVRTYSDTGQIKAYVEWIDSKGKPGRTEGSPTNSHMRALLTRAWREGKEVTTQTW